MRPTPAVPDSPGLASPKSSSPMADHLGDVILRIRRYSDAIQIMADLLEL
jgi:hypothetical protein